MTREQWKQMTPDQQRIKVAELCGWISLGVSKYQTPTGDTREGPIGASPDGSLNPLAGPYVGYGSDGYVCVLPDYLNDLNAMHDAEGLLDTPKRRGVFIDRLFIIVSGRSIATRSLCDQICHATAAQRAEAFCLTLEPEETP